MWKGQKQKILKDKRGKYGEITGNNVQYGKGKKYREKTLHQ